jgi:hypothetical protein
MPAPFDVYALEAVAGDNLRIETLDLPDKPFSYPEQFYPVLELRDPAGSRRGRSTTTALSRAYPP